MSSRRHLIASATLLACALPFCTAHAQGAWKPDRPVKLLVGFAPGGSADVLARLIAEPLGQRLGQPVIVENVAGAGGNIATGRLATSPADGYTIGIAAAGSMAITFELNPKATPYKPGSFTPITMVASQPNVLIVNNNVPANNLQEFKAYVARTPSASYGIAGIGISNHLIAEAMLHRLGVKMEAVPYKGAAPVIADLLGGHIVMTMDNITTAAALANDGKVKALGVTSAQRAPQLPNVPTLQEQGLAGFDMPTWQGVFAPAGLPAPVLRTYYEALQEILKQPGTVEKMARLGSQPVVGMESARFTAFLEADRRQWAATVKSADIKPE
jgi:tripartite-type tricarboxylate transporter receptor subunit TctC